MSSTFILIIILIALFALPYFTKRRLGILGLTLCAGYILSVNWTASLTPFLEDQGVSLMSPPLRAVVAACLILIPSVLLILSVPKSENKIMRIAGSLVFAVLAFAFLLDPISNALVFDEAGANIYTTILDYSDFIIVAGVGLSLLDVLATYNPKKRGKSKGSH